MKYICSNCNYIYDESIGEKEDGIKPGTIFWNLGDHYACPNCFEDKDSFHEVTEQVSYIDDEDTIDLIENDHFINTDIQNNILKVSIGRELHPSGEDHRISEIILLDEYGDTVETKFIKIEEDAIVEFDISDLDDYEIRVRCSIHGLWGKKFIK